MEKRVDVLSEKIEDIKEQILSGKIKLLDLELVPLFNELRDVLTINNLEISSEVYKKECSLLDQKFNELKSLLSSLESEGAFTNYLKSNPSDLELLNLIKSNWTDVFLIDSLSFEFVELAQKKLFKDKKENKPIESLKKARVKEQFLLEIPVQFFTEKLINYFKDIQKKVPCKFEDAFDDDLTQEKIYEHFVYLLHLIQSGKIKYQKETNTIYT